MVIAGAETGRDDLAGDQDMEETSITQPIRDITTATDWPIRDSIITATDQPVRDSITTATDRPIKDITTATEWPVRLLPRT